MAMDEVIHGLLVDELLHWRRYARDNGMTDEHYHTADGTGWITRLERVLAAAGALPAEDGPTSKAMPAETKPGERFYQWIVAFEVDAVWIADGFNLDDTCALMMLARHLSFANVNTELRATVLIRPDGAEILREQGVPEKAIPTRLVHDTSRSKVRSFVKFLAEASDADRETIARALQELTRDRAEPAGTREIAGYLSRCAPFIPPAKF